MVRSLFRVSCALWALALGVGLSAQAPSTPAADAFVGTWVLNLSKSTYEGVRPKKMSTRTLDTYGNGRIVATHRRIDDTGEGFSYWVGANLAGEAFPEFARQRGNALGNMVSIKPVGAREWNVTFKNQAGRIVIVDTWTVSADGKTLTIDRKNTPAQGQSSHSIEVYDNDGFARRREN